MQSGLFLDVVIRKSTTVLQLFACEDQPLLVRWNAFLVLYFCLHVVNRVAGLDIEGDRLARESLHEDLHTTTKAQYQMQRGLLLDVVIRKGTTVLQLFACEDQPLLVRWNAFLVLYFCLHVVNRVAGLDIEGDRLARGEASRRSAYHHEGAIPNATWTPSGCCNPKEYDRPPAVYLRRSAAAGQVECLPCLVFLPSRCQSCRWPQHRG